MAPIEPGNARPFRKGEEAQLLSLMKGLAEFEGYIADFALSEHDIIECGLTYPPKFHAHVVPDQMSGELLGMAITYALNWTFSGKPHLVLKELFVAEHARGLGVGDLLMTAVLNQANEIGAFRLQWTVLANNERAKAFYRRFGANHDSQWEDWEIRLPTERVSDASPGVIQRHVQ